MICANAPHGLKICSWSTSTSESACYCAIRLPINSSRIHAAKGSGEMNPNNYVSHPPAQVKCAGGMIFLWLIHFSPELTMTL